MLAYLILCAKIVASCRILRLYLRRVPFQGRAEVQQLIPRGVRKYYKIVPYLCPLVFGWSADQIISRPTHNP